MGRPSVRQQLVDAALGVFQATGFNGTSVQDLTDAAQVPKGSFYNHFENKEALAMAALVAYVGQHDLAELHDRSIEPIERLNRHFQQRWTTVKERDYRSGCFLGSLSSEISDTHESARAQFARYFRLWSEAIAGVIAEAQAVGTVSSAVDAQTLGRFVLNAWQGTVLRAKSQRGKSPSMTFGLWFLLDY